MDDENKIADEVSQAENSLKIYFKDIEKYSILSPEEEYALAGLAERGDTQAREKMIASNLKLVIMLAKRYRGCGLPFQDLIQEGNLGLIKAINKFDRTKGFRFATYAAWWIKQSIIRAITSQGRTIRVPANIADNIGKLKIAEKKFTMENNRAPSNIELAKLLKVSEKEILVLKDFMDAPISLDATVGDDDATVGSFIEDTKFVSPEISYLTEDNQRMVNRILETLDDREAEVLRYRFGMKDGNTKTLEEVGAIFDLTKERIRQIEAKALRKLRHPSRAVILKECLEEY